MAASTTAAASPPSHAVEGSGASLFVGRLLYGALLVSLATAPFEAGYPPLGRVLWATYTNLEVALFVMAAVWVVAMAVDREARARFLKLPLLLPAAAFLVAILLSSVFGEHQISGIRYVYRHLMGMLVVAAVWETLRSRSRIVTACLTLVAGASVSALLGLLEFAEEINIEPWLGVFKPQPTTVGGMLRLTGSFEYANGAAAYFEMMVPVLLGLLALFSSARLLSALGEPATCGWKRRAAQAALYFALGLCAMALVLTFSRAAWLGAGAGVALFAVGLLLRRRGLGPLPWRALGLAAAVMAAGLLFVLLTQPLFRLRLLGENDRDWYKSTIVSGPVPVVTAGGIVTVPVTVRNDGPVVWRHERSPRVNLSYHWRLPGNADYAIFEGERSRLPHDIKPGQSALVQALVWAPTEPGEYLLEWDLVQEGVTWFYQKSRARSEMAAVTVRPAAPGVKITPPLAGTFPRVSVEVAENSDTSTVPRGQLWKVAWEMFRKHPVTGVGPDGFRHLYGSYAGTRFWNSNIYTNSTYIEMFTNLGVLGGLTFLWMVGVGVWRGVRNVLQGEPDGVWLLLLGAVSALVAFLLHGFLDYFLFATPLYVAFWFVLALGLRKYVRHSELGTRVRGN